MSSEETYEHHSYDVVVIGAGGAGLTGLPLRLTTPK